jgi:hypothetical protein
MRVYLPDILYSCVVIGVVYLDHVVFVYDFHFLFY